MYEVELNQVIANLIDKNLNRILEKFASAISQQIKKFRVDYNTAFKVYFKKSYEKYSMIKTVLYRTEPKYIYQFFECNTLLFRNSYESKEFEPTEIFSLLQISNFIILKGTGGIGKSTLMKHFYLNTIESTDFIPIFIELKYFRKESTTFFDYIFRVLTNLGFSLEQQYFEYALESGCFIFLLDGYDEIAGDNDSVFLQQLEGFCDQYSDNYFIISSRPNDEFLKFNRFTVISVLPFRKEQSIRLVRKINYDNDIKARFLSELEKDLYDSHKEFASNPLLLTIMLLTYENYANIPDKRHIFYANAFDTMLTKHDASKAGYRRELKSKISNDIFVKIFTRFCFNTFINNEIEFSQHKLREYINKSIKGLDFKINIEDYIYDLMNAVCVLQLDGLNYTFTHRSFQEYFTALFLKELPDEQQKSIAIQLIEKGYSYHMATFDMLYDMAKERVEQNIILPLLLRIKSDYDVQEEYEKFDYYFYRLVSCVTISFGRGTFTIALSTNKEEINNYIGRIVYKYISAKLIENEPIYNFINDIQSIVIPTRKIMKDEMQFKLVKESWVKTYIETAYNLAQNLRAKKSAFDIELETLMLS